MTYKKKRLYKLFIILSFVVGVLVGSFSIKQYQMVASFKEGPESVGSVNVSAGDFEDETILVSVTFKTGNGENKVEPVSLVSTNLSITSKSGNHIEIVDANGEVYNQIIPGEILTGSEDWKVQVNEVDAGDESINVRFLADNETLGGYSSAKDETLYIFWVRGAASKDDLNFEFDKEESVMLSKSRPVTNIWLH